MGAGGKVVGVGKVIGLLLGSKMPKFMSCMSLEVYLIFANYHTQGISEIGNVMIVIF